MEKLTDKKFVFAFNAWPHPSSPRLPNPLQTLAVIVIREKDLFGAVPGEGQNSAARP